MKIIVTETVPAQVECKTSAPVSQQVTRPLCTYKSATLPSRGELFYYNEKTYRILSADEMTVILKTKVPSASNYSERQGVVNVYAI